jgi:hypothetical protein
MTDTTIHRDPASVYEVETPPGIAPADGPVATPGGPLSYLHWGPVFAGSIVAAATSFVLMTFGSAIGLAVASPSPTWRDASVGLFLLSGVWIILVVVGGFLLGGYIAGRLRSSWKTSPDEIRFRDGVHGLAAWAIGVLMGAALAWATATTLTASGAESSSRTASTSEPSFLAFELDRLFRSERRPEGADAEVRAEAGRIIMSGIGRRTMATEDRTHLIRLVAARTGLAPADAERRVQQAIDESRKAASQARRSGVVIGFTTAAAFAVAAAAAWIAAGVGGQHRDNNISPPLRWPWRRRVA